MAVIALEHSPLYDRMVQLVTDQQRLIVTEVENFDGKAFIVDEWTRPNGGRGISCIIEDGNFFERGGVNISIVEGKMTGAAASQMRAGHNSITSSQTDSLNYSAVGLSLILHAKNPMAPTIHFNCRFLEIFGLDGKLDTCWFGGGMDLTPSYLFEEDAVHFHTTIKDVCGKYDASYYPRFKDWCDRYFWNSHRNEARGIGGVFFDDLDGSESERGLDGVFDFVEALVKSFLPLYIPIISRRKDLPYTEAQKEWQQIRRGRYVEFNLLHDRGTKFGLNGSMPRVESILISLPLTASWRYAYEPEKGSKEADLLDVLHKPRQWT